MLINNTIVARNNQISASDINGLFYGSHNLIGNGSSQSSLIDGVDENQVGTSNSPINPNLDSNGLPLIISSVINAGDNSLIPDGVTTDYGGNPRIAGGIVDIGAYEFVHISGDANCDGRVDGSDVTILASNWQAGVTSESNATWGMGDFNGDGKVDGSDVSILAGNWQVGVNSTLVAVSGDDEEESKETSPQFTPPVNALFGIATVSRRESLQPRRLITPTSQAADVVLAESILSESVWSENDYTVVAKDLTPISAKKLTAASDELFALEMDPYSDLE